MVISTKTSDKAVLQTFAMLLEINLERLLKLKCQSMAALSKVNITCCLSYLTGEDEGKSETL